MSLESMKQPAQSLYSFSAPLLDGRTVPLAKFRGQVLLIVNTASRCGFTPQYAGLEALYRAYAGRGFAVLGFPCNQFAGQEPGTAEEIGSFCDRIYGVSFPLFAKVEVNGPAAHPIYRFLKRQRPGVLGALTGGRIGWNFTKFLVARNGKVVARYGARTKPERLAPAIERLLAQSDSV